MTRLANKGALVLACTTVAAGLVAGLSARSQGQVREFSITGRDHAFAPGQIDVQKDDLVKITFTAADIPHSFTVDEYRIAKRAGAGQSVIFEFRADQQGRFRFYCSLTQDDRCRGMHGTLTVR
jgi:heme/copper-type cytochrome/quinol oxidase subunit 2